MHPAPHPSLIPSLSAKTFFSTSLFHCDEMETQPPPKERQGPCVSAETAADRCGQGQGLLPEVSISAPENGPFASTWLRNSHRKHCGSLGPVLCCGVSQRQSFLSVAQERCLQTDPVAVLSCPPIINSFQTEKPQTLLPSLLCTSPPMQGPFEIW